MYVFSQKDVETLGDLLRFMVVSGVIFGYKGVALLFGILLAYETRNVKMKQINDSRFVGMSIYNVVVSLLCDTSVSLAQLCLGQSREANVIVNYSWYMIVY